MSLDISIWWDKFILSYPFLYCSCGNLYTGHQHSHKKSYLVLDTKHRYWLHLWPCCYNSGWSIGQGRCYPMLRYTSIITLRITKYLSLQRISITAVPVFLLPRILCYICPHLLQTLTQRHVRYSYHILNWSHHYTRLINYCLYICIDIDLGLKWKERLCIGFFVFNAELSEKELLYGCLANNQ